VDRSRQALGARETPPEGERRGARRFATRLEVGYEDRDRQLFLPTADLSESGVFLLAPDAPPVGAPVRVLLELPGSQMLLRLSGSVVRQCSQQPPGFAIRFDRRQLAERDRDALRGYLSGLEGGVG